MAEPDPPAPSHGDESIDPAWWVQVYADAGPGSEWMPPEFLSLHFLAAAGEASETTGPDTLRTRVLAVLAQVTSPMLDPSDWSQPYRAALLRPDGGRSPLPGDLDDDELALLATLAPTLTPATLRGRAADVAWIRGGLTDQGLLTVALDAYLDLPVDADTWTRVGEASFRRALEMARRRKIEPAITWLTDKLRAFVLCSTPDDGGAVVSASDVLRTARRPTPEQVTTVVAHLWSLVDTAGPTLGRRLLEEIAAWQRNHDDAAANLALEAVAELWAVQAEDRLLHDGSAMAASLFVQNAVAVLRGLPRKHRRETGIELWLRELQNVLVGMREETLEEMEMISVEGPDIGEALTAARTWVSGVGRIDALLRLSRVAHLINLPSALDHQRELGMSSISRIFDTSVHAADGRKVALDAGVSGSTVTDEEARRAVLRDFHHRVRLSVEVQIMPAWQVVATEHIFDMSFLISLCRESPWVPQGHQLLWARGLHHGLNGDFASAVFVLVPQIEQMLRQHLKAVGVSTLFVAKDGTGTEQEKAIGSLLEDPEAADLLGSSWVFELQALLSEQMGINLRNDLAHGLLTDAAAFSAAAVYATWHCLRLVVIPHYLMQINDSADAAVAKHDPPTPGV